ncbi:MAG: hypothetical protein ACHQ1D_12035, partial [Nitrososphaerales archaeon]
MNTDLRNRIDFSNKWMRFLSIPLTAAVLLLSVAGCSDDENVTGPSPIPVQTTVQPTINLQSITGFVVLAGSLVSNIPTSAITGNIGLSPAARSFITG